MTSIQDKDFFISSKYRLTLVRTENDHYHYYNFNIRLISIIFQIKKINHIIFDELYIDLRLNEYY